MSKSNRLFDLMQMLRRHNGPVPGTELAREAGVSLRTIYRDIGTLQAMGADIEGEPGFGYVLKPGFLLPPLMFSQDELHALALGAQWVGRQTDDGLAFAAQNAIAKIGAVLPTELRHLLTDNAFSRRAQPARDASRGSGAASSSHARADQASDRLSGSAGQRDPARHLANHAGLHRVEAVRGRLVRASGGFPDVPG